MNRKNRQHGFTLVEIILTLVLIGAVSSAMVSFFQAGATDAPTLVRRADASAALQETMENIIARYEEIAYENSYNDDGTPDYTSDIWIANTDGSYSRVARSTYFGPLDSSVYNYGTASQDMTTLRNELADPSEFIPSEYAGAAITATLSATSQVALLSNPPVGLDSISDRNQGFLLTLRSDDGGSLSYLFVTGGNLPAYLSN